MTRLERMLLGTICRAFTCGFAFLVFLAWQHREVVLGIGEVLFACYYWQLAEQITEAASPPVAPKEKL